MQRLTVLVATLLCVGAAGARSVTQTFPVELSRREKQRLIRTACSTVGVDDVSLLDTYKLDPKSKTIFAALQCRPHAVEPLGQVVHHAWCSNSGNRWDCTYPLGFNALHITLPDQRLLIVRASNLPLSFEADLVLEALRISAASSRGIVPRDTAEFTCRATPVDSLKSEGTEHFRVDCWDDAVLLEKKCMDGKCQYSLP
jgi:hypothetical protein